MLSMQDDMFPAEVMNMSEGGMFISADVMYAPRRREMTVTLSANGTAFQMPARIVWFMNNRSYARAGIEIISPPPGYMNYIDKLLTVL